MSKNLIADLRSRASRLEATRPKTAQRDIQLLREAADALSGALVAPEGSEETFEWLMAERSYQVDKYGTELDDEHAREGYGEGAWWYDSMVNRVHRPSVLGVDSPAGMQALAKVAATACGMLESYIRVHPGVLPAPGVPSGEGA